MNTIDDTDNMLFIMIQEEQMLRWSISTILGLPCSHLPYIINNCTSLGKVMPMVHSVNIKVIEIGTKVFNLIVTITMLWSEEPTFSEHQGHWNRYQSVQFNSNYNNAMVRRALYTPEVFPFLLPVAFRSLRLESTWRVTWYLSPHQVWMKLICKHPSAYQCPILLHNQ